MIGRANRLCYMVTTGLFGRGCCKLLWIAYAMRVDTLKAFMHSTECSIHIRRASLLLNNLAALSGSIRTDEAHVQVENVSWGVIAIDVELTRPGNRPVIVSISVSGEESNRDLEREAAIFKIATAVCRVTIEAKCDTPGRVRGQVLLLQTDSEFAELARFQVSSLIQNEPIPRIRARPSADFTECSVVAIVFSLSHASESQECCCKLEHSNFILINICAK